MCCVDVCEVDSDDVGGFFLSDEDGGFLSSDGGDFLRDVNLWVGGMGIYLY